MKRDFNELIVLAEKAKKKGGGLAAVFKLIQDLIDFEDKINDCVDAQDVLEHKQTIENFLAQIDDMYDILLKMARTGISSIRDQRARGMEEVVEEGEEVVERETPSELFTEDELREKVREVKAPQVMLNVPKVPKM